MENIDKETKRRTLWVWKYCCRSTALRSSPGTMCGIGFGEHKWTNGKGLFPKENGQTGANTLVAEVMRMLSAVWLMLSTLLYSLQLQTGSFPKPLTEEEERYYLELAAKGDLDARNVLIERNLRLVAHIMKKY